MNEDLKINIFQVAHHFIGGAVGFKVGRTLGFNAGAIIGGLRAYRHLIAAPLFAAQGAAIGDITGAIIGSVAGGIVGTAGIYNAINSVAFQPIIQAVDSITNNNIISTSEASRIAYTNAGKAAAIAIDAISENQLVIGAAVTAAALGTLGYMTYEHIRKEQSITQEEIATKQKLLSEEEIRMGESFNELSYIISDTINKTQNEELKKLHQQLIDQYFEQKIIDPKNIHLITLKYQEVVDQLPERKLQELTKLGNNILNSIAKCIELEKNLLGKNTSKILESRRENNDSELKR